MEIGYITKILFCISSIITCIGMIAFMYWISESLDSIIKKVDHTRDLLLNIEEDLNKKK